MRIILPHDTRCANPLHGETGQKLADEIYFHQNAEGTALGPFDCWLARPRSPLLRFVAPHTLPPPAPGPPLTARRPAPPALDRR